MTESPFGRWLRRQRAEQDLTQEQLAERVGCATDMISRIERGRRRPSREMAERILTVLGVPEEDRPALVRLARGGATGSGAAPSVEDTPSNLPLSLTSFVGREQEIRSLQDILSHPQTRLLTLTGPGGVGKTRLAIEGARDLRAAFPDGVFLVPLVAAEEEEGILAAIAQVLEVREGKDALLARLESVIGEQRLLLLLDNFEHLLDAAPVVASLLHACPNLKVLATSRERLNILGERLLPVPPLPVPGGAEDRDREQLLGIPSVALFVQRAEALWPSFELTTDNAALITSITHRLDGLPLALELAAARTLTFGLSTLNERLDNRLAFLQGGARDMPARHQTLRNTIAWSYELLAPGEQRLFRCLALFVGSFTLDAAKYVCDEEIGDLDIADGIASLVEKNLLQADPLVPRDPDGAERVGMLQVVREFALEALVGSPEDERVRQRYATFILNLVERAEPALQGTSQREWLKRVEQYEGDCYAVLTWSMQAPERQTLGLRVAGALWHFWVMRGRFSQGRHWLDKVLAHTVDNPCQERAKALSTAGKLAQILGDTLHARELLTEAMTLFRTLQDTQGVGIAHIYLGRTRRDLGNYVEAERMEKEGLSIFKELQAEWHIVWALLSLSDVALDQGDTRAAAAYLEEAYTRSEAAGDTGSMAPALLNLGRVAFHEGDLALAEERYRESLELFGEIDNPWGVAEAIVEHARLAHRRGEYEAAAELYLDALLRLQELEGLHFLAACLEGLAAIAGRMGEPVRAARLFGAASALRESVSTPIAPVYRAAYERDLACARQDVDEAAWESAWRAGHRMRLEEVLDIACQVNGGADTVRESYGSHNALLTGNR